MNAAPTPTSALATIGAARIIPWPDVDPFAPPDAMPITDTIAWVRFPVLAAVATILLAPTATTARGQVPLRPPWAFGADAAQPLHLPPALRAVVDLDALEYDDSTQVRGVAADLDGDGHVDYIIQSAPSLCGNGGCEYLIVDGGRRRAIGTVFGSLVSVRVERDRGFPRIDTYAHASAESTSWARYVFDGVAYTRVSTRMLSGPAEDSLVKTLAGVPMLGRRRGAGGHGSGAP